MMDDRMIRSRRYCPTESKLMNHFSRYSARRSDGTRVLFLVVLVCLGPSRLHADWPRWRGPADRGSVSTGDYPSELDEAAVVWKTPLPGKGCSTPIVVDGVIYVTAPVKGVDSLIAVESNGSPLWTTTFGNEIAGKHRNGSGCNASPVSDGDAVFVYFKSGTLAAVERDGSIRWKTNLIDRFGKVTLFWDHGTSPVLTERDVVFARMHQGESFLAAFDKNTGELSWKVSRNYETPKECDHGYSTPLLIEHDGKKALLVWGAEHLTIHDPENGSLLWSCGDFNPEANKLWPSIAMPVLVNEMAVIAYGRNDRGIPRLHGIRMSGSGDVTATNHVWRRDDLSTFVPSPVAHKGHVYLVRDKGEVECLDPQTGDSVWSQRFAKSRHAFYASPMIAGDRLYAPREDGVVFVASVAEGKFELLSENDLGQPIIGSPVPMDGRLLIRGEKELICFGKSGDSDE